MFLTSTGIDWQVQEVRNPTAQQLYPLKALPVQAEADQQYVTCTIEGFLFNMFYK